MTPSSRAPSATAVGPDAAKKALREPHGRWLGGVCTGLSAHLGVPLGVVRIAFLVLALANGLGVILYLGLWAVMPAAKRGAPASQSAPGEDPQGPRETDFTSMVAFGLLAVGLLLLASWVGWSAVRYWIAPLILLVLGAAILWQQRGTPLHRSGAWIRPAVGSALVLAGVVALLVGEVGWVQGLRAVAVVLLIFGGGAVLASPWLVRGYRDLMTERRERIREQERTALAARVHDSVLQTLTLIQSRCDDPEQVVRLARAEERRLRSWLYEPVADEHASASAALHHAAAQVEAEFGAVVEVVTVGDADWSPTVAELVAAAREAMVNAAKHAGPRAAVNVFSEVTDSEVTVFVRDRGPGFDPAGVPPDRFGLRESIMGRMGRIGGSAGVTSNQRGTAVRLELPLRGPGLAESEEENLGGRS